MAAAITMTAKSPSTTPLLVSKVSTVGCSESGTLMAKKWKQTIFGIMAKYPITGVTACLIMLNSSNRKDECIMEKHSYFNLVFRNDADGRQEKFFNSYRDLFEYAKKMDNEENRNEILALYKIEKVDNSTTESLLYTALSGRPIFWDDIATYFEP